MICRIKILSFAVLLFTSIMALAKPSQQTVVEHYTDLAHAIFTDSLIQAQHLQQAIETFIAAPSPVTQTKAQQAWREARIPYSQSEVFRFGNPIVDDWEGQVNAWPLDESFIDYVDSDYIMTLGSTDAPLNIMANTAITMGGQRIDLNELTPELLASLNELGGSEMNVATGYHAIEFLLWGQDLNIT